jgi:hypothetical protein
LRKELLSKKKAAFWLPFLNNIYIITQTTPNIHALLEIFPMKPNLDRID